MQKPANLSRLSNQSEGDIKARVLPCAHFQEFLNLNLHEQRFQSQAIGGFLAECLLPGSEILMALINRYAW
jgi:hypothetical protein